jgi:toxin CptA
LLRISLKPSRLLAAILTLAHAGAIAIVLMVDIPLVASLIAIALLLLNSMLVGRRSLMRDADAPAAIEITSDHKLNMQTASSGWCEYDVLGCTYVTTYLTIINLRQAGSRFARHVTLLPDSLHAEDFRKLRVWLRWKEDSLKLARRVGNR